MEPRPPGFVQTVRSTNPVGIALARLAGDGVTQEYRDPRAPADAPWGPFDPAMVLPMTRGAGPNDPIWMARYADPECADALAVVYVLDKTGKPVTGIGLAKSGTTNGEDTRLATITVHVDR